MTDLGNFAIAMAVAAGLTTASVAFAQAPRSPADPNSPGAVVTPYSNKAYKGSTMRENRPNKSSQIWVRCRTRTHCLPFHHARPSGETAGTQRVPSHHQRRSGL